MAKVLWEKSGIIHEQIQVVEQKKFRYMRFGPRGGWQGGMSLRHPLRPVFAYQRAFSSLVHEVLPPNNFLSIGVGTGTSLHTVNLIHPDCTLVGVEIDEVVIECATTHFQAPSFRKVDYWIGDGRDFLHINRTPFAIIFVDAYMKNSVFAPMLDASVIHDLYELTASQGTLAVNLIASAPFSGQIERFVQIAKDLFPSVFYLPVGIPGTEQNVLFVCSKDLQLEARFRQNLRRHTFTIWESVTWPKRLTSLSKPTF